MQKKIPAQQPGDLNPRQCAVQKVIMLNNLKLLVYSFTCIFTIGSCHCYIIHYQTWATYRMLARGEAGLSLQEDCLLNSTGDSVSREFR